MSHFVKGSMKITNLDILERACSKLGLTLNRKTKKIKGYYSYENANCEAVIEVPGSNYNIGVIKEADGTYLLNYDPWFSGRLEEILGENLYKLNQGYAAAAVESVLAPYGWTIQSEQLPDGVLAIRCMQL